MDKEGIFIDKAILDAFKRRFFEYRTYYDILVVEENNITDEKVKHAYERSCNELEALFRGVQGKEFDELKERIQEAIDDAYTALKTEHSRKNYQELLNKVNRIEEENER